MRLKKKTSEETKDKGPEELFDAIESDTYFRCNQYTAEDLLNSKPTTSRLQKKLTINYPTIIIRTI